MKTREHPSFIFLALLLSGSICAAQTTDVLPPNVRAVWDLDHAWKQTAPTRERICINGLWRWQPADAEATATPTDNWGYFKVPGAWPGITDYMQKDSQTLYPHPSWKSRRFSEISAAWYEREIEIPADWKGRQIALSIDTLNSFATVFVDGAKVGQIRFPAGQIDLSAVCKPGEKHLLSILVVAMPLKGVMLSYTDTANARQVKGTVARRGLCGDVYLVSTPPISLADLKVETSFRKGELTLNTAVQGAQGGARYKLRAQISRDGKSASEFTSDEFSAGGAGGAQNERKSFTFKWKPDQLWDLNTPQNQFDLKVSLIDSAGKVVDTSWTTKVGFREFWIDGRDFYLNGTRIFLSSVPIDNAQIGAALSNYQGVRMTLHRLKAIGINMVYTHNYDCTPGAHLSFEELLRAADDEGMLVSFTQPHFSSYDWQAADADATNGYARDAAYYASIAGNHPSVVFYSTSHNATGYEQDMNPDLIDGAHDPRETWGQRNAKIALRAEAIIHSLDPTRIVYHHAGGNIGSMHTINFYPNFAPIQELCDWFGHWASEGVKPLFLCEYGAPFSWDWTMYRGWYQGKREWGSAVVPWEFCLAEWDAQFFGDRAFAISDLEKANLRWEGKQYQAGSVWHRWDYPTQIGSPRFEDRNAIMGMYITDNWRAYRTWGVSGISPWEYEMFWTPRGGVDRKRKQLPVDWENLQRPGISADYIDSQFESVVTAFEYEDWNPTAAGQAVLRNNMPALAYIAGGGTLFTSKDHNFLSGQTVQKQLIIINNSRQTLTFDCNWELKIPRPITGQKQISVETGQLARIPIQLDLPARLTPGTYELSARVRFADGQEQTDRFTIDVIAPPRIPGMRALALFDPLGQTEAALEELGIDFRRIQADSELRPDEILAIGKLALTVDGPGPDLSRVCDGLKVVVFEQSPEVLQKRLGFRVNEYGLRQIFARIPDHPALAGITAEQLHDWRGEATTLPPRMAFESKPRYGPMVNWNGIELPHIWRCGNRGDVASALIEKPARGDFRPILDGGYSLQYSPLMEYRQGKGLIVFSQLDAIGRTETEPAAMSLICNILRYVDNWKPEPSRTAVYLGDAAGKAHLASSGVKLEAYDGGDLKPAEQVLILAPGESEKLKAAAPAIARFVSGGGHVLAIGLDQDEATTSLPTKVSLKKSEYIAASFAPPSVKSIFAGIGPADVYNRGPRQIPLVADGATALGDGVLASDGSGNIIFDQLIPWQFDYRKEYNLKRTYRRSSFTLTRVLGNLNVAMETPMLEWFHSGPKTGADEKRWLDRLYLDAPEEWDDPYRFFPVVKHAHRIRSRY